MNIEFWLLIAICMIGLVVIIGVFITKTPGFGRFTTSTILLVMVLLVTSIFFAAGKIEGALFANIVFAVIGFAGGLFTKNCGEIIKNTTSSKIRDQNGGDKE